MADYDSADMLARCKRDSGLPSVTAFPADADWYAWLGDAQKEWFRTMATMVPWMLVGAPTIMSTSDNKVYTFSGGITPLYVEVYEAVNGRLMIPCANWDSGGDYVWEGSQIRMPRDQTRSFSSSGGGPYARYITAPGLLTAAVEPTLTPTDALSLVVQRALIKWASRGGYRNPKPFKDMEDKIWYGEPDKGDHGLLGAYKKQNPFYGTTSHVTNPSLWGFEFLQTVHGYTAI